MKKHQFGQLYNRKLRPIFSISGVRDCEMIISFTLSAGGGDFKRAAGIGYRFLIRLNREKID